LTGTGEQRILVPVPGPRKPRYAASGHLLYVQGSTLMAAPFDDDGRYSPASRPGIAECAGNPITGAAQYGISATGSLVYISGGSQANQRQAGLGQP